MFKYFPKTFLCIISKIFSPIIPELVRDIWEIQRSHSSFVFNKPSIDFQMGTHRCHLPLGNNLFNIYRDHVAISGILIIQVKGLFQFQRMHPISFLSLGIRRPIHYTITIHNKILSLFRVQYDVDNLWIPSSSPFKSNKEWRNKHFQRNTRYENILFKGENVLTPEGLRQVAS